MIKSSSTYNLHPLMERKDGNKLLDYLWRTRTDEKYIPQMFNNNIVFQSFGSFQQNNLFLSKLVRKFVKNQIQTKSINAIGGESYLYDNTTKTCMFYTNSESIIEDAIYNNYKNVNLIDYNIDEINLLPHDTVVNLSKLNLNIIKQINNSCSNRIIIINCHHNDFWKKTKFLSNYKMISREKFIDYKSKYFITVNVFLRKSFISLGSNCAVTYNLNKYGLRNKAYPFDWCQIKMPQLIKAIDTNYRNFEKVELMKYSDSHSSYLLQNEYGRFAHEVLKEEDLERFSLQLQRRIERINYIINPVFVRIETFQYNNVKQYIKYWKQLCYKLNERYHGDYKVILISQINPNLPKVKWIKYEEFSSDWRNPQLIWLNIFKS